MIKVTDPDLLAKLNSGELKKVTDPDLLKTLNSPKQPESENESALLRYGVKDPLAGFLNFGSRGSASLNNLAGGLINKLGGHLPKQEATDFSEMLGIPEEQKNLADKLIQFAPEIGVSLAVPASRLGKVGEVLDMLPGWGKYLKTGLGNAISQGALAASQSPHEQGTAALEAGSIAAPFSALSQGILSGSPTVRNLSRALGAIGGAGLGYYGAKAVNAPEPAADLAGLLGAALGGRGGNTERRVRENMLKGITPADYPAISEMQGAASELGLRHLSPAETLGHPFLGAAQGNVGKTEGGAKSLYEAGQGRLSDEIKSIQDLYNHITESPTIASSAIRDTAQKEIERLKQERGHAARPYYEKAHEKKIAPSWVTNLENSDETIKNAIRDAMADPKYQKEGELKGLPKNSIKVLDYAKYKIDEKIESALKKGDNNGARVLTQSKNDLLDKIAEVDKDYEKARNIFESHSKPIEKLEASKIGQIARTEDVGLKNISRNIFDPAQTDLKVLRQIKDTVQRHDPEAWSAIVRNEMERLMGLGKTKEVTGSNFYNQVLANDNKFKQFKVALGDNEKASKSLDNMKKIFGRLINTPTAKTAEVLSRGSISKPRASITKLAEQWQELLSGGKYDKEAVELITSPRWTDELSKLGKITEKDKLVAAFHNLLGKVGAQAVAQ
jgi:hypothetical protein